MNEKKKIESWKVGQSVFLLLAFLTIGEYFLGSIAASWWVPLLGIAVLKAFFVVRDYMHISRLFSDNEEDR